MANTSFDPQNAPDSVYSFMVTGTGIEEDDSESKVGKSFSLSQNYPNTFNPSTTISFDIPGDPGEVRKVNLSIYDIRGKLVKALIDSELKPGIHRVQWDGMDDRGDKVSSGVYFYKMRSSDWTSRRKMTLLR